MKKSKSILITGASSGIGRACALHLDQIGFKVFAGVRAAEDGESLKKDGSGSLQPVMLDVTEEESIGKAVELITGESESYLFGLVNNAGIGISGVLEVTPEDELRKLLEVNVIGLHAVTRACLPLLRKNVGRIVNIGSSASYLAAPGGGSYAASKFAVRAITDSLRLELSPFGMCVSLVAPGAIESDIWSKSRAYKERMRSNTSPELRDAYSLLARAGERMVEVIKPIPAINVATAVADALTSGRPKFVYLVGSDARKAMLLQKLPGRFINWLMMKHINRLAES